MREYIDGETREKGMTGRSHENVCSAILKQLFPQEGKLGAKVYVKLFTRVSETRIRMPDIVVVRDPLRAGEVLRML